MRTLNPAFSAATFAKGGGFGEFLRTRLLHMLRGTQAPRILDLGCGSGELALRIIEMRPDASVVALDISSANIEAAQAEARAAGFDRQIEAVCADFIDWRGATFDAIVSDSVLYLIEIDDKSLAERLTGNLHPGGILLATIPVQSAANMARLALRRIWRTLPEAFDRIPLAAARYLYPSFSGDALADRVKYLRIMPVRLYGRELENTFESAGFELIEVLRLPNPSIAKLEHALVIWRRL